MSEWASIQIQLLLKLNGAEDMAEGIVIEFKYNSC